MSRKFKRYIQSPKLQLKRFKEFTHIFTGEPQAPKVNRASELTPQKSLASTNPRDVAASPMTRVMRTKEFFAHRFSDPIPSTPETNVVAAPVEKAKRVFAFGQGAPALRQTTPLPHAVSAPQQTSP